MNRPKVLKLHVDERTEYRLRREMPWIFAKNADFGEQTPALGDLAAIYSRRNRCIRIGICDPTSPIAVRILGEKCEFSPEYISAKLVQAVRARADAEIASSETTGLRLLSGESEGLPGLVIDAFGTAWVLKTYSACWLPYFGEIIEAVSAWQQGECAKILTDAHIPVPVRLVLRFGRECADLYAAAGWKEASLGFGSDLTPTADFLEFGAHFRAQIFQGQKTGFFLDQRQNRQLVRSLSKDAKVLDICCYSGGFSINAALGGAREVWSLDGDRHALDLVSEHYSLNPKTASSQHVLVRSNMFEWLSQAREKGRRFDLVIADPPSFASSQAQIPAAEKAYMRLFAAAADCVRPGGQLLCCSCSSHIGAEKFAQIVRRCLLHRMKDDADFSGLPADHSAKFAEARYLKAHLVTIK